VTPLDRLSLCISGFGATSTLATVLRDWFEFLGGRPSEVVYVDGGSPAADQRRLVDLVQQGLITRLELIPPDSWENDFTRCYIQEYRSGALAQREFLCFIKPDTIPLRRGREGWLAQDMAKLGEPGVLAITNSHLIEPPKSMDGEYEVHDFASLNFCLMKASMFRESMMAHAGSFIESNFRGEYPPDLDTEGHQYRRALVEWCWRAHCRQRGMRTLARHEGPDWMVFHINKKGRKFLSIRAAMRAGKGLEPHFNKVKGLYRPPPGPLKAFGKTIENAVRKLKKK
jgi:hypothetical protein